MLLNKANKIWMFLVSTSRSLVCLGERVCNLPHERSSPSSSITVATNTYCLSYHERIKTNLTSLIVPVEPRRAFPVKLGKLFPSPVPDGLPRRLHEPIEVVIVVHVEQHRRGHLVALQ